MRQKLIYDGRYLSVSKDEGGQHFIDIKRFNQHLQEVSSRINPERCIYDLSVLREDLTRALEELLKDQPAAQKQFDHRLRAANV